MIGKRARSLSVSSKSPENKKTAPSSSPVPPRSSAVEAVRRNSELYGKGGALQSQGTQAWEHALGLDQDEDPSEITLELDSQPEVAMANDVTPALDDQSNGQVEEKSEMAAAEIGSYQSLLLDYKRLRRAFREGEEERERLMAKIEVQNYKLLCLKAEIGRSRRLSTLIGKQLLIYGAAHHPMDNAPSDDESEP